MARTMMRLGQVALAAAALPLAAQSLWLPASDPVGIGRAGAGVAFGQSLEACALNPALLVTLRDRASAYVAAGMEMQSAQSTLQSNSTTLFSDDRNRFVPALGVAFRLGPTVSAGFLIDSPFMRHDLMPLQYSGRFEAMSMDLTTHRYAFQGAWAATPALSFGATVGLVRLNYSFANSVRVPVLDSPLQPQSPTNAPRGLLELSLGQEGAKTLPSYAFGFRWAMGPRWTLAGTWQAALKGTLGLKAQVDNGRSQLASINGYGPADAVASTLAPVLQGASTVSPGDGGITLPGKATLGLRQRVNQFFTWEADVRYVYGSQLRVPAGPVLVTPIGSVTGPAFPQGQHDGFGASVMGEFTLTKTLTGRIGLAQDPGFRNDAYVEPVLGGARSASFAAGFGWKALGGEVNIAWMVRQSQDRDVHALDGQWSLAGYQSTGTTTRVEGMGHLWSVGFKKAF